jgi:hypothetical protein
VTDEQFLDAFERTTLPTDRFGHEGHVRLAFLYLTRDGRERGGRRMRIGIKRYAAAIGMSHLYNETLTTFWIHVVGDALARHRPLPDHRALVRCAPDLADRGLQYRYWTPELLKGDDARRRFVPPDLAPLP